jgi:transcriptional regulator with XRE-family HTH domain
MVEQEQGQFDIVSIGERLRVAREAKGMSLDDVANRTRIPIRHLQHIETEDWDALPAVTYAIGFTRNYANAVGLDGAEIAVALREQIGGVRNRAPAAQYYEQADPARVPPRSLAIAAALLAIVLLVGFLVWSNMQESAPAEVPILEVDGPPAAGPDAPAAVAPQAAAGQSVTLTATGEVWLRVSEGAGGPTLYSGTLGAGQTFAVPATARQPVIHTGRPQLLRASVGASDLGPLEPVERTIDGVSLLPQDLAARPRAAAAPPVAPPAAPAPLSSPLPQ